VSFQINLRLFFHDQSCQRISGTELGHLVPNTPMSWKIARHLSVYIIWTFPTSLSRRTSPCSDHCSEHSRTIIPGGILLARRGAMLEGTFWRASSRGLLDQRLRHVNGLRRRATKASIKADGDAGYLLDRDGPTRHAADRTFALTMKRAGRAICRSLQRPLTKGVPFTPAIRMLPAMKQIPQQVVRRQTVLKHPEEISHDHEFRAKDVYGDIAGTNLLVIDLVSETDTFAANPTPDPL
jgi:hypothetical protein